MIWCVEDDASIRDIEVYALQSTGLEARGFEDGSAFWAALQTELMEEIWGTDYLGESRTVDMHIRTLRQKLGKYGDMIETVRNVGYRLEVSQ